MVMAYEAYVIHHASSSQLVTLILLSLAAFSLYESRIQEKNIWN